MTFDPVVSLRDGLRIDPELPPGVVMLQSDREQIAWTASYPGGLWSAGMQEDIRSFTESMPYLIRMSERGQPIRCECCGTPVALTPEAHRSGAPWKPAAWEFETLRKHTLRRCEWSRTKQE